MRFYSYDNFSWRGLIQLKKWEHVWRKKQASNIRLFSALACIFCGILFYQFVSMNAEIININANCNDHSRR